MVFVVSLGIPAKKALPGKVICSSVPTIIKYMPLDPESTTMDVVILTSSDVKGPKQNEFNKALETKHPGICVIYIYTKDADKDKLNTENKVFCKKIKDSVIADAVQKYVTTHLIQSGATRVTSQDFKDPGIEGNTLSADKNVKQSFTINKFNDETDKQERADERLIGQAGDKRVQLEQVSGDLDLDIHDVEEPIEPELPKLDLEPLEDESQYESLPETSIQKNEVSPSPFNIPESELPATPQPSKEMEKFLAGINNYEDWQIFKENLNKDSITQHLISENAEYKGLMDLLESLDQEIEAIWRNDLIPGDQKFEKIREIGLERSVHQGTINSINVSKAISIITTITMAAARTVEDKVNNIDLSLYKITTDKRAIMDTSKIDEAIEKRAKVQVQLLEISRSIVDLYKAMNLLVNDEIASLDAKLPSNNEFINTMMPTGTQIFTPANTAALATNLIHALQENRITASQMEDKINNVIDMLFKLCQQDEEIIKYQQNMINLLKAHRVEDVVIVDTLIKDCLRLYVGPKDSGLHATAITWSGVQSREHNTLLIDLSCRSKFREYGIVPMNLSDFLNERVEKNFLCVEADHRLSLEELQNLVVELKSRLNFYPYVNIIIGNDDPEMLDQLSADSKTINYITNCTTTSIQELRKSIKYQTVKNVAKKLILIDCPINPLMVAKQLDIDPSIMQLITIPNIQQIKSCSLSHDRPYEFMDISAIFKEAFR